MAEVLETFSSYRARIEQSLQDIDKPIILLIHIYIPSLKGGDGEALKWCPLLGHYMSATVRCRRLNRPAEQKRSASLARDEDVFRYMMNSWLLLNRIRIRIKRGRNLVWHRQGSKRSPSRRPLRKDGSGAFFQYDRACRSSRAGGTRWMERLRLRIEHRHHEVRSNMRCSGDPRVIVVSTSRSSDLTS